MDIHDLNNIHDSMRLTASADGILDVTPVHSRTDNDSDGGEEEDYFESESNEPEEDEEMGSRQKVNEDAFSSSSEEEGQQDDSNDSATEGRQDQSEWDKALRTGKPSTGHASDFFAASAEDELHVTTAAAPIPYVERPISRKEQQSPQATSVISVRSNPSFSSSVSSRIGPPMSVLPPRSTGPDLDSGILPDVLMAMRQKIESLSLFDSDMMRFAVDQVDDDPMLAESREALKRSSQQSISASVLVSLAHKRYERRRIAAMEIEKIVRSLVEQGAFERVRAIFLLLSDDYVRSSSSDARKGGVVALAACAYGMKKAPEYLEEAQECRDLILASVVHACQDHEPRVRYYASESLFNVIKALPSLAVQHFFILFEILRSLYADVDDGVRSGAELLDKRLKEVIVGAMNAGTFAADACVPVFARFVHEKNKATKRLTLTWLQELNEKLIGAPILEFLHLFLGAIFDMIADPTVVIRQSALAFLQSVLPKLLVVPSEAAAIMEKEEVNFDKILQSLVTTMEHPDPFVRKVAMYWMSRIVKAHMGTDESAASLSVRNSVPHVLPGILLSIGDNFRSGSTPKDSFLPDQTTQSLAEQTNACLQDAVRRDGESYVQHLEAFIVSLREELDSPGGLVAKNPPAIERTPYRLDVNQDGSGIERTGWFRSSSDFKDRSDESIIMSRLCALEWVTVLYESVVPNVLKAEYAREFIFAITRQLVEKPPDTIVFKSLEVLANITVPATGEGLSRSVSANSLTSLTQPIWANTDQVGVEGAFPMTDSSIAYGLEILESSRRKQQSRDREVFSVLIQLYSQNQELVEDLSKVMSYMCKLQPSEFVLVSFAIELDRFVQRKLYNFERKKDSADHDAVNESFAKDLKFASSFVQHMNHVLLNRSEAAHIRQLLKDCIGWKDNSETNRQRSRIFHILLHSFAHNVAASVSLCLWAGAYRSASTFITKIDPLEINLMFLLEIDRLVEMFERPLFRHLHIRMLERDEEPKSEGSGTMLFQALKSLLMILPQSTCYRVLRDRLCSVSRFRQSSGSVGKSSKRNRSTGGETDVFVSRLLQVRALHCSATWRAIRAESLEILQLQQQDLVGSQGADRREWLGYESKEEELDAKRRYKQQKSGKSRGVKIEEVKNEYHDLAVMGEDSEMPEWTPNEPVEAEWKQYWATTEK